MKYFECNCCYFYYSHYSDVPLSPLFPLFGSTLIISIISLFRMYLYYLHYLHYSDVPFLHYSHLGVSIVEGKALTYFTFDTIDEGEFSADESPKQKAYGEIVHSAVDALLTAKEAPKQIQELVIEIVHVGVKIVVLCCKMVPRLCKEEISPATNASPLQYFSKQYHTYIHVHTHAHTARIPYTAFLHTVHTARTHTHTHIHTDT